MRSRPSPTAPQEDRLAVHRAVRPPGNPPLDPAAVTRGIEALDRILGR